MDERLKKYWVPLFLGIPSAITKFFFEGVASTLIGIDFPYGWISLICLSYMLGLAYNDFWPGIVSWFKNWGVHFRIREMDGVNGTPFRDYQFDGMNYQVYVFAVENKRHKTISNIEIDAKIARFPMGQTVDDADPIYGAHLEFEDGTTAINGDSSKTVILAHQRVSDKEMFFGSPQNPQGEISAGLIYRGLVAISGHGSKTKRNPFLIEAMQFSDPVLVMREMDFDSTTTRDFLSLRI